MGDSFVLPIEQTRVTRQQAKVQQIIAETDAKAQQILDSAQNQAQTYNFLHEPLLVPPMFSFPEAREPGNFQGPVYSTWKFLLFSFSSFKQ